MASTGQTINDRLNAVRYALVGQGLARTVCKATTEEIIGPKKKHIDYLIACTNEPNVSIPQLANLLIERSQHSNWAVVFKSLISMHHLMSYGNEKFTQYLATSNHAFDLNDFMDRSNPQGYNMSTFVRNYAKYINDKTISYRTLAIDLCKIKSEKNDNALRTMNMDNLSKTLPIVQTQFDSLLNFGAESKDLNNGIIMAAFRLLYKDLVRIYVAYQEAIINLLERYFKLSRRKTREALEMYKNYLSRMDKVAGFLQLVDAVGLDKSEMPDLTKSPASILEILEKHLATLEAKKRGATPASPDIEESVLSNKENQLPAQVGGSDSVKNQPTSSNIGDKTKIEVGSASTAEQVTTSTVTSVSVSSGTISPKTSGNESNVVKQQPLARNLNSVSPEMSPSTKSSSTAGVGEKKQAAPVRPAKPPSRPPPPATPPGAPQSSASSSSHSPGTSTKKNSNDNIAKTSQAPSASASKTAAVVSMPPPHPPPPHPPPPSSSSLHNHQVRSSESHRDSKPATTTTDSNLSQTMAESDRAQTTLASDTSTVQQSGEYSADSIDNQAHPPAPPPLPEQPHSPMASARAETNSSCFAAGETEQSADPTQGDSSVESTVETNHVSNNVDNRVDDIPPPPPIDDSVQQDQAYEAAGGVNNQQEQVEEAAIAPTNGQQVNADNADAGHQDLPPRLPAEEQLDQQEVRINGQNESNDGVAE